MLSKMMSPSVKENYFATNGTSTGQRKLEQQNSKPALTAEVEADKDKSENSEAPGVKPYSNPNWQKFLTSQKSSSQKQSKRQHPHPGKSRKKRFKARRLIDVAEIHTSGANKPQTVAANKDTADMKKLTKQIAIDCEMVGIGDGTESMVARVSLVNSHGHCVYDKYVKPMEKVEDYRTAVSGIRPHHLRNGEDFKVVQAEVAEILHGRLLIGHALKNDLNVLFLSHPKRYLRDTSRYKPFRKVTMGNSPSLKKLASELLGINIQTGEHNSVEDARTAMQLYMLYRNNWETEVSNRR